MPKIIKPVFYLFRSKTIKKILLVFVLLTITYNAINAQAKKTPILKADRVFWGGNIGFNVSSNYWVINLSPQIGYKITPPLSVGVGIIYQYENNSIPYRYYIHSYGGAVFTRYDLSANLMKNLPFGLFFQTDYEWTQNQIRFRDIDYRNRRETVNIGRLLIGAGYIQPISMRSRFFFMISIDVLNRANVQPVIRGGFVF